PSTSARAKRGVWVPPLVPTASGDGEPRRGPDLTQSPGQDGIAPTCRVKKGTPMSQPVRPELRYCADRSEEH
ncbi:hypothetical protein Q604_UNBC03663G0001, partial [human gut metagenome]